MSNKQCKSRDPVVSAKKKMLARIKRERKGKKLMSDQTARDNGVHVVKQYKSHPCTQK